MTFDYQKATAHLLALMEQPVDQTIGEVAIQDGSDCISEDLEDLFAHSLQHELPSTATFILVAASLGFFIGSANGVQPGVGDDEATEVMFKLLDKVMRWSAKDAQEKAALACREQTH